MSTADASKYAGQELSEVEARSHYLHFAASCRGSAVRPADQFGLQPTCPAGNDWHDAAGEGMAWEPGPT